MAASLNGIPLS